MHLHKSPNQPQFQDMMHCVLFKLGSYSSFDPLSIDFGKNFPFLLYSIVGISYLFPLSQYLLSSIYIFLAFPSLCHAQWLSRFSHRIHMFPILVVTVHKHQVICYEFLNRNRNRNENIFLFWQRLALVYNKTKLIIIRVSVC